MLGALFPHNGEMAPVARHFNQFMGERYARIVDFIKLHYCLSKRREQFWIDNCDPPPGPTACATSSRCGAAAHRNAWIS